LYPEKRYTFAWPSSADGTIRADVAAEEVAVAVLGQLRGIGLQRLVDSPAIDTERLAGQSPTTGGGRWPALSPRRAVLRKIPA